MTIKNLLRLKRIKVPQNFLRFEPHSEPIIFWLGLNLKSNLKFCLGLNPKNLLSFKPQNKTIIFVRLKRQIFCFA